MEEDWMQRGHQGSTIGVHSVEHTSIWGWGLAHHGGKWRLEAADTEEDSACLLEGRDAKHGGQRENCSAWPSRAKAGLVVVHCQISG